MIRRPPGSTRTDHLVPYTPVFRAPRSGRPGSRLPRHEPRQAQARFALLLALARGAVAWEIIRPALWPLLGVLGAFLAVALFDVLPALSGWLHSAVLAASSAERRVGKECVSTCRSRWSPVHSKKKTYNNK